MVAQIGYDEIASLLAEMDPTKVVSMKASPALDERVEDLIHKKRDEGLTESENIELEHYLIVNRIVGLAKIRAKRKLHSLLAQ